MMSTDFADMVEHLVRHRIDAITNQSYLNCHVTGLHSIMLIDTPGQRVRLFYADTNHELWRNEPTRFKEKGLAIGFHPHHCDLTLKVVQGKVLNWVVTEIPNTQSTNRPLILNRYLHESAITQKGKISFSLISRDHHFTTKRLAVIGETIAIRLGANELHTVAVPEGESAAWLVMEGREDAEYDPFCYSNTDLEKVDFSKLYQKPTTRDVIKILNRVFF